MSKVADTRPAPTVLAIPEHAHFSLVQVAYFLRLMANLTEPGTNASNYEAQLRPSALSWCFSSLSKEIDAFLCATYPSDEIDTGRREKTTKRRPTTRF